MNTTARVGRNDSCPCGSGRKYKACCERREQRVDVLQRRSRWPAVVLVAVGLVVAGGAAAQILGRKPAEADPASAATPAPLPTPTPMVTDSSGVPVQFTPQPAGAATFTPQPPGTAPPGKVWSPEHGHWHDAPSDAPFAVDGASIGPQPGAPVAPPAPGAQTAQPPGPVPPGKVWSPEHGHWHDAPSGAPVDLGGAPMGPLPGAPAAPGAQTPQPPGPVPPGKVWSAEHGHWHDAPPAPGG